VSQEQVETSQTKFDSEYITASEAMQFLGITRAAFLYGRRTGKVPEPIVLNEGRLFMWKRAEINGPLRVWKEAIDLRKVA
jgi:predicted DNA-binding transcriptional regulator AlpA